LSEPHFVPSEARDPLCFPGSVLDDEAS